MAFRKVININPDILIWARTESGLPIDDIVAVLKIDYSQYLSWENSGNNVSFSKLQITDHRNLNEFSSELSPSTLLAIRRANRYCDLLNELNSASYYQKKYEWIKEFQENFSGFSRIDEEDISIWLRNKIGFTLEDQFKVKYQSQIYKIYTATH